LRFSAGQIASLNAYVFTTGTPAEISAMLATLGQLFYDDEPAKLLPALVVMTSRQHDLVMKTTT
jgi:hypothetical protein